MLKEKWGEIDKGKLLLASKYKPFPSIEDRKSWGAIEQEVKDYYVIEGEKLLEKEWPILPAIRYMDFVNNGDRTRYQTVYFERRSDIAILFMAECTENKGRFIEQLINGIWAICEESSWVVPAHNSHINNGIRDALPDFNEAYPYIDLFSAETGSLLAWIYYFMKDRFDTYSPSINQRIVWELNKRIITPYIERTDFWWMGFGDKEVNNWNPWINSNCLPVVLLTENDPARAVCFLEKCIDSMEQFLDVYGEEGGCNEGPGYWNAAGASLFDCLEMLYEITEEKMNLYHEEKIKNIGRYIYKVHIAEDKFVNFADGNSRLKIATDLIFRYGKRIGDDFLMSLGQGRESGIHENGWHMHRHLKSLWKEKEDKGPGLYARDSWIADIQVMAAREYPSPKGLFLAAKGGHNDESHNHNDIGHFIVYANGNPIIIDVGVGTYTAKTFSENRYDIWTMQSGYHNLPTVNGYSQKDGKRYRATQVGYHMKDDEASLALDIKEAYPEEANIECWKRICQLVRRERDSYIEVEDNYSLKEASSDANWSLLTPCICHLLENHQIRLELEGKEQVLLSYDNRLDVKVETIELNDSRLLEAWGNHIYRIKFNLTEPMKQGQIKMRFEPIRGGVSR